MSHDEGVSRAHSERVELRVDNMRQELDAAQARIAELESDSYMSKLQRDIRLNCAKVYELQQKLESSEKSAAEMWEAIRTAADKAYCDGCELSKRDVCLGEEYKMEKGWFGPKELHAHREAAQRFGAHFALESVLKALSSDAGRDYVPLSEVKPLVDKLSLAADYLFEANDYHRSKFIRDAVETWRKNHPAKQPGN